MYTSTATLPRSVRDSLWAALLGVWAASVALAPTLAWKAILVAPVFAGAIALWILHRPQRWMYLLFFCLLALPPLPAPGGDSGLQVAPLAAGIGVFAGLLNFRSWRMRHTGLTAAFTAFLAILLVSAVFAAFYSGVEIAAGSLIRILLFAIGVYVFVYTLAADGSQMPDPIRFVRFLFGVATAGAIFACIDFYFHLPAPAGYGAQFVWLEQGVFRRAQGLFYEASTLGNFCAFFLALILVCLFRPAKACPIPKSILILAGGVFGAALIFSYSRASIVNVALAALTLVWLRRNPVRRAGQPPRHRTWHMVAAAIGVVAAAVIAVRLLLPSFSSNYWSRIVATIQFVSVSPNGVLSGRLTNWSFLGDFLWRQPWTAIFGIGYKTLPYSDYAGATIVADNTYLQLLVETGIVGLFAFLYLNREILRVGLKAARSSNTQTQLFGQWIFCFWIGQVFQMFSGDLITYWRVLPVYFWVLAVAARQAKYSA